MTCFAHAVGPNEPCIFVEIFVPVQSEPQRIFYETLNPGFRRLAVINHFFDADHGEKEAILEMLGRRWTVFSLGYPEEADIKSFLDASNLDKWTNTRDCFCLAFSLQHRPQD